MTLLSKKIISLVDFGMVMNSPAVADQSGSFASAPAGPDVEMTGRDGGGALHGRGGAQQHGVGGAQQQTTTEHGSVTSTTSQMVAHEKCQLFQQVLLLMHQLTG